MVDGEHTNYKAGSFGISRIGWPRDNGHSRYGLV